MNISEILFPLLLLAPVLVLRLLPSKWRYAPMDKPRERAWVRTTAFFRVLIPGEAETAAYWGVSACYVILLLFFSRAVFGLVDVSATVAACTMVVFLVRRYENSTRYRRPLVSTSDPVDFKELAGRLQIKIEGKEKTYLRDAIATIKKLHKTSNAPVPIERLISAQIKGRNPEQDELLLPLWDALDRGEIGGDLSYQVFRNLSDAACREIRNENISRLEIAAGRRYINFVIRQLFIERFKNEAGVYVFREERFPLYRFLMGLPSVFDREDERIRRETSYKSSEDK